MNRVDTIRSHARQVLSRYSEKTGKGKPFFNIKNLGERAEVLIYDVIDSWMGVGAEDLIMQLHALDVDTIDVRIHSPGGDVFETVAITSALNRHPATINTHVDGWAFSAASDIVQAGSTRYMTDGARIMIHDPWTGVVGNARDMLFMGNELISVGEEISLRASKRTEAAGGLNNAEIVEAMAAETWYKAGEALEAGLIDEVVENEPAVSNQWSAASNMLDYKNAPSAVAAQLHKHEEAKIETVRDFEKWLRDAGGFSKNQSKALASSGWVAAESRDDDEAGEMLEMLTHFNNKLRGTKS